MKAVVFEQHGGPEVLQYRDIPVPDVPSGNALVRIRAIGQNFNDVWARSGLAGMDFILPHVSGSDASGVVEAVGSDVTGVKVGDEVVVSAFFSCRNCTECMRGNFVHCRDFRIWGFQTGPCDGAHAEYCSVPAANLLPKPENLSWEEAASMP